MRISTSWKRIVFVVCLVAALLVIPAHPAVNPSAAIRVIHVDDNAALGGNGSGHSPYNNLMDALEEARTTTAAVAIKVAPGDYAIESSLVIDRSLELRGSSVLIEDADGWPTGAVEPGTETRIFGTHALGTQPVVSVGRLDGDVIDDVVICGFAFEGTSGGIEVLVRRVQGYTIKENLFRAPAFLGLQTIASSGRVAGNHFTGVDTGAVLAGGYVASPSIVTFTGNRVVGNNLGGLVLNGASIGIPELGDKLDVAVRGNDLSNNTASIATAGVRLFILRRDLGAPGDSQSTGNIRALLQGNRIIGNRIGLLADAGFPYRRVGTTCDQRVYSGSIDLTLKGNTLTDSLLTPALITFTRNTAALNPATLPQWQYLHDARFTITDREGTLADAWIDHPERDPVLGPCVGDIVNETLNNILRYNTVNLSNGRNF
jgi:hypothetical protein